MPLSEAWVDFVAGWCSGASAVLACQPLDTLLTRFQAAPRLQATTTHTSLRGMAQTLTESAGVKALWRGSSPMIGAVPLQNALLMGGYGVGQKYSESYAPQHRLSAIFVGGCTGGVLQSFLMSPVELVKVSQQVAGQSLGQAMMRNLVLPSTRTMAWRGLGATLLRDGIPHGVWFVAYEMSKDCLQANLVAAEGSVVVPLTSGAVAATVAWAVGYPADLIKTRIQASSVPLGILDTARQIVQEANGQVIAGLYRGFGIKLVRAIPASMIGFTVYEIAKASLERL